MEYDTEKPQIFHISLNCCTVPGINVHVYKLVVNEIGYCSSDGQNKRHRIACKAIVSIIVKF